MNNYSLLHINNKMNFAIEFSPLNKSTSSLANELLHIVVNKSLMFKTSLKYLCVCAWVIKRRVWIMSYNSMRVSFCNYSLPIENI
jgi:hypothetical protein